MAKIRRIENAGCPLNTDVMSCLTAFIIFFTSNKMQFVACCKTLASYVLLMMMTPAASSNFNHINVDFKKSVFSRLWIFGIPDTNILTIHKS